MRITSTIKKVNFLKPFFLVFLLSLSTLTYAQTPSLSWATSMGGNSNDEAIATAVDASGNVFTIGTFKGTANFGSTSLTATGGQNVFVSKQDAQGSVLWVKPLGESSNSWGMAIALDASGNLYATGYFQGTAKFGSINLTAKGKDDIFACKMDVLQGNVAWAKSWGGSGNDLDRATSMAVNSTGDLIIAGYFKGSLFFDQSNPSAQFNSFSTSWQDIFISKFDAQGNFIWAKQMGGTDGDIARTVVLDASDNIYITGLFQGKADFGNKSLTSAGFEDGFVCKMDPKGDVNWVKRIGGRMSDTGYGLAVDASGNVYVTGYFQETADFAPDGQSVNLTAGNGGEDIYVCKFNKQGELLWASQAGISSNELNSYSNNGQSIALDKSGDVYVTGFFTGSATFGGNNLSSASGKSDIFISKLDAQGNFKWAVGMGAAEYDRGNSIAIDAANNLYVTGSFQGKVNFDPSTGKAEFTSKGESDVFVLKLSQGPSGIASQNDINNIVLFPNPAKDNINLKATLNKAATASIVIYDLIGREVYRADDKMMYEGDNLIQLNTIFNAITPGIYMLELSLDNGSRAVRKIEKI